MWVKMKTDQTKAMGIYLKGQVLDLPESIVEKFDEGSYEETVAPWDANVPPVQLRLRAAEKKVKDIKGRIDRLEKQINDADMNLSQMRVERDNAARELEAAEAGLAEAKKAVDKIADVDAAKKADDEEAARKAAEEAKADGKKAKDQKQKSKGKSKAD